ncbi:hypothetical protein, partial [Sulfitobacter pontiacus]|uniref:hypothetical protein n=1 Tax=Sulfitobacter pontiacus TaxID=60137 RepID=UPI00241C26D9
CGIQPGLNVFRQYGFHSFLPPKTSNMKRDVLGFKIKCAPRIYSTCINAAPLCVACYGLSPV